MKRVWLMLAVFGAASMTVVIANHDPRPHTEAPAVTVVKLANGQNVTCITIGGAISCDFLGYRTDPAYKEKP